MKKNGLDTCYHQWGNGVICTYGKFKRTLECEKYLQYVDNTSDRISLTRLRISAHSVRIERGRYERVDNKVLSAEDRICKYCNTGEIEDEHHFVINCKLYDNLRSDLINRLSLSNLSKANLFRVLMSCNTKDTAVEFSKYVNECFKKRTNSTSSFM